MANEELTLTEYYKALLQQRKLYRQQGNNLLNPTINNNVGEMAALETSFQQGVDDTNVPEDAKPQNMNDALKDITGFADEIAARFGAGFVGSFEGLADLAATGIAAIGDNTGWFDSTSITDWVKTDYASRAAEWTKTYGNFTPWGIENNIRSMAEGNDDTRRNFLAAVFGGPAAAAIQTLRNDVEIDPEVYKQNPNTLEEMGQLGQFIGGISEAAGFMVPAILLGNYVGSAAGAAGAGTKAAGLFAKLASTAYMGTSAAGRGAQEALSDDADATHALAYGAATGAIEAATEWVFPDGGVGGFRVGQKALTKGFIKELAKEMVQEGAEEVLSGLAEPILKGIYKGEIDWEGTYQNKDWYLGTNGNFNESLLGQFTSGAVSGGLMSGVQRYTQSKQVKAKYGAGSNVAMAYTDMLQNLAEAQKYDKSSKQYQKYIEAATQNWSEMAEEWEKVKNDLSQEDLEKLRKAISDPIEFKKYCESHANASEVDFIASQIDTLKDAKKAQVKQTFSKIARLAGLEDYTIEFKEMADDYEGNIDKDNKVITLNTKYEEDYGSILAHELVSHGIVENLGNDYIKNLASVIKQSQWYKDYEDSLVEQYQTKDDKYQILETQKAKDDYFNKEVVANFLQNVIAENRGQTQQIMALESLFQKRGFSQKVIEFVEHRLKSSRHLDNAMLKAYRDIVKRAIQVGNNNRYISKIVTAIQSGDKLSKEDEKVYNKYKEVFDLFGKQRELSLANSKQIKGQTLDEDNQVFNAKKLPNGKDAISSPIVYQGNKYKIIDQIFKSIPSADQIKGKFYDAFSGSLTVSLNADLMGYSNIVANELDETTFGLQMAFKNNTPYFINRYINEQIREYDLRSEKGFNNFVDHFNSESAKSQYHYLDLFILEKFSSARTTSVNSNGKFVGKFIGEENAQSVLSNKKALLEKITALHNALKTVKIQKGNAFDIIKKAKKGDFIYVDPPYNITNAEYNRNWTNEDQMKLLKALDEATNRGVRWAMSNVLEYDVFVDAYLSEWSYKYSTEHIKGVKYTKGDADEVLIKNYNKNGEIYDTSKTTKRTYEFNKYQDKIKQFGESGNRLQDYLEEEWAGIYKGANAGGQSQWLRSLYSGEISLFDSKENGKSNIRAFIKALETLSRKGGKPYYPDTSGRGGLILKVKYWTPEMKALYEENKNIGGHHVFYKLKIGDNALAFFNDYSNSTFYGLEEMTVISNFKQVIDHERAHHFQYREGKYNTQFANKLQAILDKYSDTNLYDDLLENDAHGRHYYNWAMQLLKFEGSSKIVYDEINKFRKRYGQKEYTYEQLNKRSNASVAKEYNEYCMKDEIFADVYAGDRSVIRIFSKYGVEPSVLYALANHFTDVISEKYRTDIMFSKSLKKNPFNKAYSSEFIDFAEEYGAEEYEGDASFLTPNGIFINLTEGHTELNEIIAGFGTEIDDPEIFETLEKNGYDDAQFWATEQLNFVRLGAHGEDFIEISNADELTLAQLRGIRQYEQYYKDMGRSFVVVIERADGTIDQTVLKYDGSTGKMVDAAGRPTSVEAKINRLKNTGRMSYFNFETLNAKKLTKAPTPITFKSVETTRAITESVKKYLETKLGKEYTIKFPKNIGDFTSRAFSEINSVKDLELETRRLRDLVMDISIEKMGSNNAYEEIGTVRSFLTASDKRSLKAALRKLIKTSPDTIARGKATVDLEKSLNRVTNNRQEVASRLENTRLIAKMREQFKKQIDASYKITQDNISRDGLAFLMSPFRNIKGGNGFSAKGFSNDINEVLKWYNEKIEIDGKMVDFNEVFPHLPYYPELRQALLDVYDSLGTPRTVVTKTGEVRQIYGYLSADSLQLVKETMRMIQHANIEARKHFANSIMPSVIQTINAINDSKYGIRTNFVAKLFRKFKRGAAPAYIVLKEIFGGNSALANEVAVQLQIADNSKKVYVGSYTDAVNKILKKLKLRNKMDKSIMVGNHKMTMDQAMYLYISLQVDENFEKIDQFGAYYQDEDGRIRKLADKNNATALQEQVDQALPENFRELGDWLLETMNDQVKKDYMRMFEERFGKYAGRNEIGEIGDKTYWMLARYNPKMNNIEKAVKNPAGVFSHAKSRTGSTDAVLIGNALGGFNSYIEQLGNELYIKPKYRNVIGMLNVKTDAGDSVMSVLKSRIDPQDFKYIQNTLDDVLGALDNKSDWFSGVMARFSVAKLSLNIGTMLKQFASIWTSNIPFRKSTKAVIARMVNNKLIRHNSKIYQEYKTLIDGVKNEDGTWKIEPLGGLKYRSNTSMVVQANANGLSGRAEKLARFGMLGISKVDVFTIGTGVFSLMIIAQDQFDYAIGSQENIDFVKQHWTDFELSQIGSGALSKNAIARGDYGAITKGVFGFLQGAQRAAFGAQIEKAGLWKRNHKLNEEIVKQTAEDTKKAVEEFQKTHKAEYENEKGEKVKEFNEALLTEEETKEYIELKSKEIDANVKLRDFNAYKIAGGKTIPANMTIGLVAQGIFIALINELMKHIKGKKDWDEWDILDLGANALTAIAIDWIPLINTLVGSFVNPQTIKNIEQWIETGEKPSKVIQVYETSLPVIDLLNDAYGILEAFANNNSTGALRKLLFLVGNAMGIPAETLYQYVYGTIKAFDPAAAYEFNSFLYGTSLNSVSSALKGYIEKGDVAKTAGVLEIAMDKFRVATSESTRTEIARLLIEGYDDVMPKQYMTQYTDEEGNIVKLTAEQITQFRELYDLADDEVQRLINSSAYNNLTSEEKAKLIKKVYDAYYNYAKASITGSASSRLSKLLYLTNNNVNISKYVTALNAIASITETKRKTRKELVIAYVNKLKGLTRQEKLLLLNLAGYSTNEKNEKALIRYLISKGMSKKDALEFV